MRNKHKLVYHIYDNIRIITPNVFVRVGYPLTKQIVKNTLITKEQYEAVITMLKAFGINYTGFDDGVNLSTMDYDKIVDVLAGNILRKNGWGGKERTIHIKSRPDLLNKTGIIYKKRIVHTGTYTSGYSYKGYFDDYPDYEPAYLSNRKSHVILTVAITGEIVSEEIEIEECNVIKEQLNNDNQ